MCIEMPYRRFGRSVDFFSFKYIGFLRRNEAHIIVGGTTFDTMLVVSGVKQDITSIYDYGQKLHV